MPCARRCSAGPMPESWRICGEPMAPAGEHDLAPGRARPLARRSGGSARRSRAGPRSAIRRDQRAGLDLEVRPPLRRAQIGDRGRAAQAAPGGQLEVAGTLLDRAVEVVVARDAELRSQASMKASISSWLAAVGDRERAARAVEVVGAARLVLGALEVGQDVVERPAGDCRAGASGRSPPSGRGCRPGR